MKHCVVNVAAGNDVFRVGQQRLEKTLRDTGYVGDIFAYNDWAGGPSHHEIPYGFKVTAIERARRADYDCVIWADATIVAVKNIQPLFTRIAEHGHMLICDGHPLGQWSTDAFLKLAGIDRETAWSIPLPLGGFVGYDFSHPVGKELFRQVKAWMSRGAFNGPWSNENHEASGDSRVLGHRHDQCVLAVLMNRMGLKFSDGLEYEPREPPREETFVCVRGIRGQL